MKSPFVVFVANRAELRRKLQGLKNRPCPFCKKAGTLNRHSRIDGNDPDACSGRIFRGQRVFCSNRCQHGGCGHTFSMIFAWVLPRHTVVTTQLWAILQHLSRGKSIKSAWEILGLSLALETFYHLLHRVRYFFTKLRVILKPRLPPAISAHRDPLRQLTTNLRLAFPSACDPIRAFQYHFQRSSLG